VGEFRGGWSAALRDAIETARLRFDSVPDLSGSQSCWRFDVAGALMSPRPPGPDGIDERAYEDVYRQFIEPVVGASVSIRARSARETPHDRPDASRHELCTPDTGRAPTLGPFARSAVFLDVSAFGILAARPHAGAC
jgi:hypothetical protein